MTLVLIAAYRHIDPEVMRRERLEKHRGIKMVIATGDSVQALIAGLNPERDVRNAPAETDWMQYFSQVPGSGIMTPLPNVPHYYLDTKPVPYISSEQNAGRGPIHAVVLRHSGVRVPYYTNPTRSAVLAAR